MDEWINNMSYIDAMGYYSALKRKEMLTQATAWMNLEGTVLSERSRHRKTVWSH